MLQIRVLEPYFGFSPLLIRQLFSAPNITFRTQYSSQANKDYGVEKIALSANLLVLVPGLPYVSFPAKESAGVPLAGDWCPVSSFYACSSFPLVLVHWALPPSVHPRYSEKCAELFQLLWQRGRVRCVMPG